MNDDPLPRLGERIALRRLAPSDLEAFQRYRSDARLARYQGWTPMSNIEAEAFIAQMRAAPLFSPGAWRQLAIADRATDDLIGDVGLFTAPDHSHVEIGFTLAAERHGSGLATEAVRQAIALVFSSTRIERVVATTDARNAPSIHLLQRLGFVQTETRRSLFKGEWCDEQSFVAHAATD